MSEKVFIGGAIDIAQVTTIAVQDTWATDDTATLTIGNKSLTLTVGTTATTTQIAAELANMVNGTSLGTGYSSNAMGDEIPEFMNITASADTGTLTLTADDAGVPFEVSVSESTAGDGTLGTPTDATAATGKHFWNNAANWDGGAIPVNSDDAVLDARAMNDILYGLDQNAVTLASLTISNTFTRKLGLPPINADDSSNTYPEYRDQYLKISVTALSIEGQGSGSGRIKLNLGSAASTMNISARGTGEFDNVPAVLILGTHSTNIARITRGSIGFAFYDNESAHLATLAVGFEDNQAGDATVICGDGVDLADATITQSGGTLTIDSACATTVQSGGTLNVKSGNQTTITADGTLNVIGAASALTITTLNSSGGTIDFRKGTGAVTVSNCAVGKQTTILDPAKRVTWSAGIDLTRCGIQDLQQIDLGKHFTLTPSAI